MYPQINLEGNEDSENGRNDTVAGLDELRSKSHVTRGLVVSQVDSTGNEQSDTDGEKCSHGDYDPPEDFVALEING